MILISEGRRVNNQRASRKRRKKARARMFMRLALVVFVISVMAVSVMGFMSYNEFVEMRGIVDRETIYKNIYINDINVGGYSKEQALDVIDMVVQPPLKDKKIVVTAGDKRLTLTFGQFDATYDYSEAVDQAYRYAREGSIRQRYDKVSALDAAPYKIEYTPKYSYDPSTVAEKLQTFADGLYVEPVDATISRVNGVFYITQESNGRRMNVESTAKKVIELLASDSEGIVEAMMETLAPELHAADLENAQSLLGTYHSSYATSAVGRATNVENAASKINDVVVYPGEVFSTNALFGETTYENGYRIAPVIVGGKLEDGMGGGVCQVSSTLYNAVLYAELEIVERQNHSLKVAYMDYGFDATLSGDYIDFKFRNDTDYPIFVEAITQNRVVTINIYGYEIHSSGRSLVFQNELIERVSPGSEIVTEDSSLPLGQRSVTTRALEGVRYAVYKIAYEDGKEVSRERINTSFYKPVRGEVRVGTGPAAEVPVYEQTPEVEMPIEADVVESIQIIE